jgi:uncharacterized protein (DUF1015 family)
MYRHEPGQDVSALVAPPYDVIDAEMRQALLARHPHNVVGLELPDGPLDPALPGNRYETGRATWDRWRHDGILVDDETPAVYVLEQSWQHDGRPMRRRAFVAAVRLHPFSDGVVLPHERTLPKALADRFELLRATAANLSPVFGLFSDPECSTDAEFDAAMQEAPLLTATDAAGVLSRLWAIRDPAAITRVATVAGSGPVFIADGHHRYTTALAYRDERRAADAAAGHHLTDPAYDFVMMALVNMDDPDLHVMATHRLARAEGTLDVPAFWAGMERLFDCTDTTGTELAPAERPSFVVRTADGTTRLTTLRADVDPVEAIPGDRAPAWKTLDVTVLQELVLGPILGIRQDDPRSLERLAFSKDATDALSLPGGADVAFVLAPTRLEQLRAVALAGEVMPQKTTYFYPKLLSGLLFKPLD